MTLTELRKNTYFQDSKTKQMKRIWMFALLFMPGILVAQIEMVPSAEGILFRESGKDVVFYQIKPKSLNGKYERSHYFHPLWGLDGQVITEDFPKDHPHHRGIFWAWHQVLVNDKPAGDLWELKGIRQEVREVEFISRPDGAGEFRSDVVWVSKKAAGHHSEKDVVREECKVIIHKAKVGYRQIDFEISLYALHPDVKIGGSDDEKGYGGFSVRSQLHGDVRFQGKQGSVVPENTAVESPGWINLLSQVPPDMKRYGLTIIDQKSNPGYPQPWILRSSSSMQNAVYPGCITVALDPIKPLVLRYSVVVHNGNLKGRKIGRIKK